MDLILRLLGIGTISKITPVFGGITFVAAVQSELNSPWVDVWRLTLTLGIGIFVTLCGVIWRDINRRMREESESRDRMHKDNQRIIRENEERQNRIVGVIVAMAIMMGKDREGQDTDKLFAALQAILK